VGFSSRANVVSDKQSLRVKELLIEKRMFDYKMSSTLSNRTSEDNFKNEYVFPIVEEE
jgi:hypothetical protein